MILRRFRKVLDLAPSRPLSVKEKRRRLKLELLEDRKMLAFGPELLGIDHNNGKLIQEGGIFNVAPRELTFRFDDGQVLDRSTLNAIRLVRSGSDGIFDNGNDLPISPSFLDLGQNSYTVLMRFPETLVDDRYRISILGVGPNRLRNAAGISFNDQTNDNVANGSNFSMQFRLELGAKVISVVPQPITRDAGTGVLTQAKDQVEVYFNNDALNPASATNPAFYRLIDTQNGSFIIPQSVSYDPVGQRAVLTFASDLPTATYQLKIGPTEENNSIASQATDLGTLNQQFRAAVYNSPVVTDVNGNVVPTAIPDGGTAISSITVADSFLIADVNVDLNIDHTWGPDLRVFLQAPGGQRVELVRDLGSDVLGGQIYGVKFSDLNSNGLQDAGEAGLSGWTIFIDPNGNGKLDAGERSTVTDSQGRYSFVNLPLGQTYQLVEVPQAFFLPTTPVGRTAFQIFGTDFSNGSQQTMRIVGAATTGTFRLGFGNRQTADIVFVGPVSGAATAVNIQQALALIVDSGTTVSVTSVNATQFTINFAARDVGTPLDHAALQVTNNALNVGQIEILTTGDASGFTSSGPSNLWKLSAGRGNNPGHSPSSSFYFGQNETAAGGGSYTDLANGTLRSPEIDLTDPLINGPIALRLNHRLNAEASFDFAEIRAVANDVTTVLLRTSTSTVGFQPIQLDLSAFAGKRVALEFNFTSDGGVTDEGWYVDDVSIEVQRATTAVALGTGPQQKVIKDINFGSNPLQTEGSDAFGYRAYSVTTEFEDITTTGNRVLQSLSGNGTAFQVGGTGTDTLNGMTRDAAGNLYITGSFQGSVDFDPGAGTTSLTSAGGDDVFVAKYNAAGDLLWARNAGGTSSDVATAIAVDGSGNVVVTGSYLLTATFGGSPLTSVGSSDAFVWKLDSTGATVWARSIGGASADVALGVDVASNGDVVAAGSFSGSADLDPGAGVQTATSAGGTDAFVLRLTSAAGNLVWARQMGGTGADSVEDVHVTAAGNIITTGAFNGTVDFNPGAGVTDLISLGGSDGFVQLLTSAGNFTWARRFGVAATSDQGNDVTSDAAGNVYVTGVSNGNILVQRMTTAGATTWSRSLGGALTDRGEAIHVSADGTVSVAGSFRGTTNFGGGNQIAVGGSDAFALRLNSAGNFVSVNVSGGTQDDSAIGIQRDASGNIYIAGNFRDTVAFNVGSGTQSLTSNGGQDAFVTRVVTPGGADDATIQLTAANLAGFQFNFYGTTYSDLFLSINGLISFVAPNASGVNTNLLSTPIDPTIAAFWEDLRTGAADSEAVFWQVVGTGNDQRLIVQWSNVSLSNPNAVGLPPLDFQAILSERDGSIQLNYRNVSPSLVVTVGSERPVGTFTKGIQVTPAIASDAVGNYVVVWTSPNQDGDGNGIFGRRYTAAGIAIGNEFQINTTTALSQANPRIAMNASGQFVVTWAGNGAGDTDGVFAQIFSPAGVPVGVEFVVNQVTTNSQSNGVVGIDDSGNIVISWSGQGTDDTAGVFLRRYNSTGVPLGTSNEIQRIRFPVAPTVGSTFSLRSGTQTTGTIAYTNIATATSANIANALVALGINATVRSFVNDIQTLTFPVAATGGTIRLDFGGFTTTPITFAGAAAGATTATNIQNALAALTSIGVGNVTVTQSGGTSNTVFVITLNTAVAGIGQPITVSANAVVPAGVVSIADSTPTVNNEVQTLTFTGTATGGTVRLVFGGSITTPITFAAGAGAVTATNIQTALTALLNIGAGNVTVTPAGASDTVFIITFTGALAGLDQALISLYTNALTPAGLGSVTIVETTSGYTTGLDFEVIFNTNRDEPLLSLVALPTSPPPTALNSVPHLNFAVVREGSNGEIRVNNRIASAQSAPRLDVNPSGAFTVSWTSTLQDGSLNGVFAKRFDASGVPILPEVDEVQRLVLDGTPVNGSTFRLRMGGIGGATTGIINYVGTGGGAVTAANIQTALRLLPNLGEVTVSNIPGTSQEIQQLDFNNPTPGAGTFLLAHRGQITAPIVFAGVTSGDATTTATNIQNALRALPNLATDLVNVAAAPIGANFNPFRYTITFVNAANQIDHPPIVFAQNNLNQGTGTISTLQEGGRNDTQFIVRFGLNSGRTDQPPMQLAFAGGGVASITVTEDVNGRNSELQVNTTTLGDQQINDVATRNDGSFFVVWQSAGQDGDGFGVYGKLYSSTGVVIRDEFQINTFTQGAQSVARVGTDTAGNFVVTWSSALQDGSGDGVFARILGADGFPLGDEFQVNTATAGNQTAPAIAVNPNGTFVVSYSSAAVGGGIQYQRYTAAGVKVGTETQVSQFGSKSQQTPLLARSNNGNYVVVWQETNRDSDNSGGVYAQVFNAANVALSGEFAVAQITNLEQSSASVDIDDAGRFVVVWRSTQPGPNNTTVSSGRGRRFDPNGVALGDEFQINTPVVDFFVPSVDVDPTSGRFTVVWDNGAVSPNLFGRTFAADGTPLTAELLLQAAIPFLQNPPRVALHPSGDLSVIWSEFNFASGSFVVQARIFTSSGAPKTPLIQVNVLTDGDAFNPDLKVDSNGVTSIVWFQGSATEDIVLRRYDANGNALGAAIRVNDVTGPQSASISIAPDNSAVVTWFNANAPAGSFVQRIGSNGGLIGNNFAANDNNWPAVSAGNNGTFLLASLDGTANPGSVLVQNFASDSATVGIKGAGVQTIGASTLPVWVDGIRTALVGSNQSLRISRIVPPASRLFGIGGNQLLELNSLTGTTIKSTALPTAAGSNAGLAFSGSTVYYVPSTGGTLYEIDPDTGATVDTIVLTGISVTGISGLAFLNGEVVVGDATANQLIFLDPATNRETRRITPAITLAGGLVGSGVRGTLFAINSASQIVEINATNGAVVQTIASPGSNLTGLAFVNGEILASDNTGTVHRINPTTGLVVGTLAVAPGVSALGADGDGGVAAFRGGNYQSLVNTILDDEAGMTTITEGVGPYTGRFVPVEPLSLFDGTNVGGNWTLQVQDTAIGNTGVLNSWRLRINEAQDTPADIAQFGAIGDNADRTVAGFNDVDVYRFSVLTGGAIKVDGVPQAGLDLVIRLFDSQGNELTRVNAAGVGGAEQLNFVLSSAGVYFVGMTSSGNLSYNIVTGAGATGGGSQGGYSMQMRFNQPVALDDNNSSFDTATPIGSLGVGGQRIRSEVRSQPYLPTLPGGNDEPGHRHIQPETHLDGAPSNSLSRFAYNFQNIYGALPTSGAPAVNAITENQKQRAREVFEILSKEFGVQFFETASSGLTIVTGDLRVIDPTVPGGPGGATGISEGVIPGRVIMDAAENWGNSEYGGAWFETAMHEILHSLGLGHTYDLPALTVMGGFGTGEPVFPGDHDIVHGKHLLKPGSIDQDLYRFSLNEDGVVSLEAIAERLGNASFLDPVISLYREIGVGRRELVARNDDYYSNDSFLRLPLTRGTYFVGVSAAENKGMDPGVSDTGFGGTSEGDYELSLRFEPATITTILDAQGVALDGDADGTPGGSFNFFFEAGNTIFVDRLADTTPGVDGTGTIAAPLDTISAAIEMARTTLVMPAGGAAKLLDGESFSLTDTLNREVRFEFDDNGFVSVGSIAVSFTASMTGAQLASSITAAVNSARTALPQRLNVTATVQGANVRLAGTLLIDASDSASLMRSPSIVRIIGNAGPDRNPSTLTDNVPYLLGVDGVTALRDGGSFQVPQGVTVMVDAGALFKLRSVNFDAGTSAVGVDRSEGALQILGTAQNQVSFYSYRNDSVGGDSDGPGAPAQSGDWGGLVFRDDSDKEASGIFLNWVNNATLDSGGGRLVVNSVEETFAPVHTIGARPSVTFNTIRRSADAAISADPASFFDDNVRIGLEVHDNKITNNSINGLFVRIRTELGSTIDKIVQPSRWDDTDIVYVLTENLLVSGTPGGPQQDATGRVVARQDGRLTIDPGIIVKLESSRIEVQIGGQLIAEGTLELPVIFTSLTNDSYGGSGTYDTKSDGNATTPAPGQWGGLFFANTSKGSIDRATIEYGGGLTPIEGGFDRFNVLEVHQGEVRLANSLIQNNASGATASNRNGRGSNAAATVFVRGAQPIIVNNLFKDNQGTVIHINANSLQAVQQPDYGRITGTLSSFNQFADNYGPLVRLNRLQNNTFNGMEVRGAVLTTESVWDDTDIAHILRDEIMVLNHHTYSGLHLLSTNTQSLVVKLSGATAGFTADGTLLDIDDRIGGSIYIGARGRSVILTALTDDTAFAGTDAQGLPQGDVDNNGTTVGSAGAWRSIRLDRYSNDRNVAIYRESEPVLSGQADTNRIPTEAEFVGLLAPDLKSGDTNRRLGFEVYGNIAVDNTRDVDVYSFTGVAGSEVFFDIDQTGFGFDSVLELIDASGRVIARSLDASVQGLSGIAQPLIKDAFLGDDFYSITTRDSAMRVTLPGNVGSTNTYFVRIRSNTAPNDIENLNGGVTRGEYKLQVRLRQLDEKPGSFIRNADIRFATNGIEVIGLPSQSPLLGETVETRAGNDSLGAAQPLGNLLVSDRNTISAGGNLSTSTDVDWYRFELDYDKIQAIGGFTNGGKTFATIFDIDYADGIARGDTVLSVFDANGNLILVSRDSNIEDDQATTVSDLSRGSFGTLDPYIGSVQLPAGSPGSTTTYYVAVSSNSQLPAALNGTFTSGASNTLVRLEPINSIRRIAEDHIGFQGHTTGTPGPFAFTVTPTFPLFNISTLAALSANVVPFTLNDVALYTATGGTNGLKTVNPFTGSQWTNVGSLPTTGPARFVGDLTMRSDGRLFMVEGLFAAANNTAGQLVELDPGTGAVISVIGTDSVPDFDPATNPPNIEQLTSSSIDAFAWRRTDVATYDLFYSIQGARRGAGQVSNSTTLYRANPAGGSAAAVQGQPWGRVGEIFANTPGDLGRTTGMAFIGNALFGVSDTGLFYQISANTGAATILGDFSGTFGATGFQALSLGPQNLEGGRFANMLFALAGNGTLVALNTAGVAQAVFTGGTSATSLPATGIAFSALDFNLWHPTMQRRADPGHGINASFDNSRNSPGAFPTFPGGRPSNEAEGGASFRFGLSQWVDDPVNSYITYGPNTQAGVSANIHRDLSANPLQVNNYNLPGGALGSLRTGTVSLASAAAADKPTLYFNYFLETENQNNVTNNTMRDSARVLVSRNGGATWELLASNNSILSTPALLAELPRHIAPSITGSSHPRRQVQELFDNTGGWRQARVDLSAYAGQAQLQFRFDFSTAGALIGPGAAAAQAGDPSLNGNLFDNRRGQNNQFEGFYVDDIIVGFAERGEVVTNAPSQSQYFTIPQNPNPADPSQILVGEYQLELRRGTEYADNVNRVTPNIFVFQTLDTNDRLTLPNFRLGDSNLERVQGQILIYGNSITDTRDTAIIVDAGTRDAGGSLSHPGGVRNLPTLNNERLTFGPTIENNILADFGIGGILFSGDANPGTLPLAAVPFGRIVNNTVFGGNIARGIGINVTENASPTLLNNVISNTANGLLVDASSSTTIIGANLFKGNTANGVVGQNALQLQSTDPLFVNASVRNFYPANGSFAVDSSLNLLADRANFIAVNSPLGIPPAPILAPDRDRFNQLRVDDPSQNPPPGLGSNVFKDRGAVERADFRGPTALLIDPLDNDGLGADLNPLANEVLIQPNVISQIRIQLQDQGIGIDDLSITSSKVRVLLDNQLLINGTDYQFVYDSTNKIILLRALKNNGPVSNRYEIILLNRALLDIQDLAGNAVLPNQPNGQTRFVVVTGGSASNTSLPDFTIASSQIARLEDNELETGVSPTAISSFAGNLPPVPGIGEPAIVFALVSLTNPGNFSQGPAIDMQGRLTFVTAPNRNGSSVVVMRLTEVGVTSPRQSSSQTFTISLSAVNDAPEFTLPATLDVLEDQGLVTINGFAAGFGPGPATAIDEVNQNVSITTTAVTPAAFTVQPTIDATGRLQFRTRPDYNSLIAPLVVIVSAIDDGPSNAPNKNQSPTRTFTINVIPVNDPPTFTLARTQIDVVEDEEDFRGIPQSEFAGVATNITPGPSTATDEATQSLTFVLTAARTELFSQQPAIDANGKLIFKTAPNRSGTTLVFAELTDDGASAPPPNQNRSTRVTFTVSISPINDAPEFTVPATYTVQEDAGAVTQFGFATNIRRGPVTAVDEGNQLINFEAVAIDPSAFSTLPFMEVDGTLRFQTAQDVNSSNADLRIRVRLTDNGISGPPPNSNQSAFQTITLIVSPVNDSPIADAFSIAGVEDTGLSILSSNVLIGDNPGPTIDEAVQSVRITQVEGISARGGTVVAVFSGTTITSMIYTPPLDLIGVDTFLYVVSDDGSPSRSGTGTITVVVAPINDPPQFTSGANVVASEDAGVVSRPWAQNILAGPLGAFDENSGPTAQTVSFEVTNNAPLLFTVPPTINAAGLLTFTSAPDAIGSAVVTVIAVDSGSGTAPNVNRSSAATFTIQINPVNDPPVFSTVVAAGSVSVDEDSGAYNQPWATKIAPAAGLNLVPPRATDEASQTVRFEVSNDRTELFAVAPSVDPSGNLRFTPAANANGIVNVVVRAIDNGPSDGLNQNQSLPLTFTLTINSMNDAPIGVDDRFDGNEDNLLTIAAPGVLVNDTDVDLPNDSLSISSFQATSLLGATVVMLPTGSFTYDPRGSAGLQALIGGETARDVFTYIVRDQAGSIGSVATVTITVAGSNDPPVAINDRINVPFGVTTLLDVLTNDRDADTPIDPRTVEIGQLASHGTVTTRLDGRIEYRPNPGYRGPDSITYRVRDSLGALSNEATVTINVNSPPIAVADSVFTPINTAVVIDVLRNDSDPDGSINRSTVTIVLGPDGGTATVQADGTIRFTPGAGFTGATSLQYSFLDNEGLSSNVANVAIQVVNSTNQNPVNKLDVNADGFVSPIDVLIVVNDLNFNGTRVLPNNVPVPPYLDVNGNRSVDPLDVLELINFINSRGSAGAGEGEASMATLGYSQEDVMMVPTAEIVRATQEIHQKSLETYRIDSAVSNFAADSIYGPRLAASQIVDSDSADSLESYLASWSSHKTKKSSNTFDSLFAEEDWM